MHTNPTIDPENQRLAIRVVALGCTRDTAARFLGYDPDQFDALVNSDPAFEIELARAEAGIEIKHMQSIAQATNDPKQWRLCVWWLEQMRPELCGSLRLTKQVEKDKQAFVTQLIEILASELDDEAQRTRVLSRLTELTPNLS